MKDLILISHGHFCKELKKSVEMIMGEQKNIHAIALEPNEGQQDFCDKLKEKLREFPNAVVMSDLMGGTPCNVAVNLLLSGEDFQLYAGMNMPMVISFINDELINQKSDIVEKTKESILKVNLILETIDDEEE